MSQTQSNLIRNKWQAIFTEKVREAEQIAQSSQRERAMSVEQLVQTLVLGCLEQETVSLRSWCEVAADLGCQITTSSLDERLTQRAVMLLHLVLQASVEYQVAVQTLPVEALQCFSRMVLYDSTVITLPPQLRCIFQGTSPEQGALKAQLAYDYLNGQLSALSIQEGRQPDQKDAGLLAQAVAGALLIFDLGYFNQQTLAQIAERQAYFVTPYQSQTALYDPATHASLDLVQALQQTEGDYFEINCLLGGKTQLRLRLIARRVSAEQAEKQRRGRKRQARQGGYTPSARSLLLCEWEIIVTNLPVTWRAQQVLDLYRVRWQIELIFKGWKSYLRLARFGDWRPERVLCQLYAGLIGAVLCQTCFAVVRYQQLEASFFKSLLVIRRHVTQLLVVIRHHWWGMARWSQDLAQALLRFARQPTLKAVPSTLQRLINWSLT